LNKRGSDLKKRFFLSSLVTLGLLYLVLKKVGLGEIIGALKRVNGLWLGAAFLLMPLQLFLKVYKWRYLLRLNKHSIRFGEAAKSLLGGIGIGIITPARVGEITRVLYLKSGQRLRLSGLVIIDKFFDLFVVIALAIGGLTLVLNPSINALLLLLLILLFYFLFNPGRIKRPLEKLINRLPFKDKISEVLSGLDTLNWRVSGFLLFLTFLAFIVDFFQFYLLLFSFGEASLKAAAFAFPLVILANILPLTVGGLGIREGVSVIALSLFGVAKEVAVNASFSLFLINTLIPGIGGIFLIYRIKIKK
jgi:uncharacterized protein (TIRG00374 family)